MYKLEKISNTIDPYIIQTLFYDNPRELKKELINYHGRCLSKHNSNYINIMEKHTGSSLELNYNTRISRITIV